MSAPGSPTKLCLCLTAGTLERNLSILEAYGDSVDAAELRVDLLEPGENAHVHRFPDRSPVPVILTVRRRRDGGGWAENEAARCRLLQRALRGGYRFVDLETDFKNDTVERIARRRGIRIIRSLHVLDGAVAPRDMRRLERSAGEIAKLAVAVAGTSDLLELLRRGEKLHREKILIGMGSFGAPTRILAARLGSSFCYASPPSGRNAPAAAPGQVDVESLLSLYRFRRITAGTPVFGVIGNPIMHSLSPRIHNPAFEKLGIDAVYLPFRIDRIEDFFTLAEALDIRGVSVTVPHKETVLPLLSRRSEAVGAIGAANTLVRDSDGNWIGENTDAAGFIASLASRLNDLGGKRAAVIGAGGAARSVVYALRREGFRVLILNRTPARARSLARIFDCEWAGLDERGVRRAAAFDDLIVQTTSVGMFPDTTADPLPDYRFSGRETVYEIVYNPPLTPFLRRAQAAGCRIIPGREMLLAQAAVQFALFTGVPLPSMEEPPPGGEINGDSFSASEPRLSS